MLKSEKDQENFPVDLTKFEVSKTLKRILESIVKNDCTDISEIRIAMRRTEKEGEDKLYKELESKLLPLSIQKQERRKEEKKKKQDEIDQKAKEREELLEERQLEIQLLKKKQQKELLDKKQKELLDKKQLQKELLERYPLEERELALPHLGPYYCGIYHPKNRDEDKYHNDPLTKLLAWNKNGYLSEDVHERISVLLYKTLEQKTDPANIEIIVPVPNHLRHSARCNTDCRLDNPNSNAPPLAKALAAMICKKTNRNNCQSHDDVLVRLQKSNRFRKKAGKYDRFVAANNDYCIANSGIENNHLIKDQIVLLIDDIKTSGATTRVCADLLVQNGAKQVIILCAAETATD